MPRSKRSSRQRLPHECCAERDDDESLMPEALVDEARRWWHTDIIDIHPGQIALRGYPIEELIGNVGFVDTIWLMIRGELPSRAQAALFEAALVASVDHGPQAPSIAIARMATTCGVPVNGAMASAINVLDDIHGGVGQQCMQIYLRDRRRARKRGRPRRGDSRRPSTAPRSRPEVRSRLRSPLPSARSPHSPSPLARRRRGRARHDRWPLRRDRSCRRRGDQRGEVHARSDEHRRSDRRHLLRTRPATRARPRGLHPGAVGRHPRACLRADDAGGSHQGSSAESARIHYTGPARRAVPQENDR